MGFQPTAQAGLRSRLRGRAGSCGAVFVAALLGGCKVGPNYVRPEAEVAEAWLDVKDAAPAGAAERAAWWREFGDPALDALVEEAFDQNLTLRQAGLRVIQARGIRGIAAADLLPQLQAATAQAGTHRTSAHTPFGAGDRTYHDLSVGAEAVWELDLWGRFRRGVESADATLDAAVADYDAFLVALAADVAFNYVTIRSLEEQLAFARTSVQAQQDTTELTRVRFDAGAVSELDVATAEATLANTRALVPALEDAKRRTKLALGVLLGETPSELESRLGGAAVVPAPPAEIAVGVPADLLRRRPDVRRAERQTAALCARIGVAEAEFYPSITLSGATGFQTSTYSAPGRSTGLDRLFDPDSFMGFVGLGVRWPLFDHGRIAGEVRFADAAFQEAAVAYQHAVLVAAADVEAGLSGFLRSREQAARLAESVRAAERTVELSLIQYRQGAADFLRVNQAQVDLVARQIASAVARADVARGAIAVYRALGGGWETRASAEFVPQATIDAMRARTDWGDVLPPASTDEAARPSSRPADEAPSEPASPERPNRR